MAHGKPNGAKRRREITLIKQRNVMALHVSCYGTLQEIADHPTVRLSKGRVSQIISKEMKEVASEFKQLGVYAFDKKMLQFQSLKGNLFEIIQRRCPVCIGNTTLLGYDPCEACADTGWFYELADRMMAVRELIKVSKEESDLLGEHAPDQSKVQVTLDMTLLERLGAMPEEELDEIIEMFVESETDEADERQLEAAK